MAVPSTEIEPKTAPHIFPLNSLCSGNSDSVVLGCLAQGFFPEPVNFAWNYSGSGDAVKSYPAMLSGGVYTQTSALNLSPDECPDSSSYRCSVEHYETNASVMVPCKGKCNDVCVCDCKAPQVSLSPPSLESLLLGTSANLTCTVSGLTKSDGVEFTWNHISDQASTSNPIQGAPEKDASGKYSVSSVLTICAEEWTRGDSFSCTVSHPELKDTITKTIQKSKGPQIQPQVYLLPPSSDELALNEVVSITCLVKNFSPQEVLIKWLKGSEELPKEDYITFDSHSEPRNTKTFMTSSILQVSTSNWKEGSTYSCVVGHEALPLNFTQRTIDQLSDLRKHEVIVSNCLNEDFVEEDDREATLWPMTVTFLTLFLLSMFYNTTVTLIKTKSGPNIKY